MWMFNPFFSIWNVNADPHLLIINSSMAPSAIKEQWYTIFMTTSLKHRALKNSDIIKPLSANPTKWSNALKQFVGKLPTNYSSVFDHFVGLALKGIMCNSARSYSPKWSWWFTVQGFADFRIALKREGASKITAILVSKFRRSGVLFRNYLDWQQWDS